jgi:hypothetical protein
MHPTPHLESVIRDLDRHVSRDGWQQPPRLFALVAQDGSTAAVEQPWTSDGQDVVADLARIAWPAEVSGAAVSVQRVLEPDHDVRLTVAALRTEQVATAVRYRTHDEDSDVAVAPGVAPRLERALWETLS